MDQNCCVMLLEYAHVGFPKCEGKKEVMENMKWIYSLYFAERHLWGERVNFGLLQNILTFLLH